MTNLSIDIETYSSVNLVKSGVYRYVQSPDFEVLLFAYSIDGGPVSVVDLANGEELPSEVLFALVDPKVTKWAFNAQFERVCLSRYLGADVGVYLDPAEWRCTMLNSMVKKLFIIATDQFQFAQQIAAAHPSLRRFSFWLQSMQLRGIIC